MRLKKSPSTKQVSKPVSPVNTYLEEIGRTPSRNFRKTKKTEHSPSDIPFAKDSELYRKILQHIGDEILIANSEARVVYVNEAAARGLGYPKNKILGAPVTRFFKEKMSVPTWKKTYFRVLKETKKVQKYVLERVVKGRKIETIDARVIYMKYQDQELCLSMARDITEEQRLKNELKHAEEQFHLFCEQAADGIFFVDLKGIIQYANPAALKLVNIKEQDYKGRHFSKFVSRESIPEAMASFRRVKRGETVKGGELNVVDKMKRKLRVEYTSSPIYKNDKIIQIHTIIRDVSQRRQLETLIRESEKMKALQHFISGTAQEIQHPLESLLNHTKVLVDNYSNRDFEYIGYKEFRTIMKTLKNMRDQIKYCRDTTQRMLAISKRKVGIKEASCQVNMVIRESIRTVNHLLVVSDTKLSFQAGQNLPQAAIGPIEMGQVMINVLTNAIQSIAGSGNVLVRTRYHKSDERIWIECRDTGVGIDKEDLPRVFEPFFTTKQRGLEKSSGLGLAIVYSIVKSFQGDITIKSNLRQGTTVKISLPVFKKSKKK